MIVAAPPPSFTPIIAAVKTVYPRSPIHITRICVVEPRTLVRLRVKGRDSYVALERRDRKWKAVWVDGSILRSVLPARRATVATEVRSLRTRCLAP